MNRSRRVSFGLAAPPERYLHAFRNALIVTLAAAMASSSSASAQDSCVTSYEKAQELRRQMRLVQSRAELRLCERSCPTKLADDCKQWTSEIEGFLPTVKLSAATFDGKPRSDVRVTIDGAPFVDGIGPEAVAIDPGDHVLRFQAATGEHVDVRVTIVPGAKDRAVDARFPEPPPRPPLPPPPMMTTTLPPPPPPRSPLIYVLGTLGVGGIFTGAVLGIKGQVERSDLRACAPYCRKADVQAIATEWYAGGIAAGIGGAALGAATILWFATAPKQPARSSLQVRFAPSSVALSARF